MGAWSALSRLAPRLVPQAVILLYHRVADPVFDPQLLCVSPENFAGQMEVLSSRYRPCSLGTVARRPLSLPLTVAVTFDDGYADNYLHARPVLERLKIPATVFASTAFTADGEIPYWDELASILLRSPVLPGRLVLTLKGERRGWEFDAEPAVDPGWNVLEQAGLLRQRAYLELCDGLRLSPPARRLEIMDEVRKWAGGTGTGCGRFMTLEELRLLAQGGLVEVGGHTVSHQNLALLSEAEQESEIVAGKEVLAGITGREVTSFAYPYGTRENYSEATVRIVRRAGFDCACSNLAGAVRPGFDRYQLPRMLVRNWGADEFARRLAGFFA